MLAIGPERFDEFLAGANEMDRHFGTAPLEGNMPVLLALIGIWHRNICGYEARAILPYDQRLEFLPAYLQQLDMESNGKGVSAEGEQLAQMTGPLVWGAPGTNGQHAFFQWLHQGRTITPCEFLVAAEGHENDCREQHDMLLANCLAQSEALANGRVVAAMRSGGSEALAQQRSCPGGRPSITLLYRKLDPRTLGRLLALYEHRIFVEGTIWGINSFDQWGVELGKEMAKSLLPTLQSADALPQNPSTKGLVETIRLLRKS